MRVYEGTVGERPVEAAPAFQLDAMRSVRLHPKLATCVACVVLVLTVGYALTRKPLYEARSLSYVEPLVTKLVSDGSQGFYDPARYDSYFQQQIQTATRQDILEAAIKKMPDGVWQQPGEDLHHAAERLANTLKVERVGSSYQLAISVQSEDAEKASAIVNAATNAYLEQGRKDENARSDGRLVLLQEESQRIQKEMQQDRDEQTELSKTLGVADTQNGGANPYDLQLAGVRTELISAREAHDVAAAQLASVSGRGLNSAGLKAIADEAIASDSGLSALKTTINERRAVLNTQMATLTPTNPVYKQDADEIASMDKQVEARSMQLRQTAERRVEDKLRLDLQRTGDVEARLNEQLAHATSQAGSAAPKLQRAKDLAADIMRLQVRYATVDDALRGLQLESSGPGTAHLLVAARVPDAPAANRRLQLLALALPLAAFAGILAAVLARKTDMRLYSAMDLEKAVGVAPMCELPASYSFYDAAQDEHLLRLATALERGHRMNGARMFVFTAASRSMDTAGLIHGVQTKLSELGFKSLVLAAADVRQTTAAERKLGKGASQIEQLKRENAFMLIDAMPLLHSADTEYAVSCADATMVVAENGLTTSVELKQCMLLLQKLKATGVGTILLSAADEAVEAPVRRQIEVVEQQRTPVWERTRGRVTEEMSVVPKIVPKQRDEEGAAFKTPAVPVDEKLPKRVQLVPAVSERIYPAPAANFSEPEIRFEEAVIAALAPVHKFRDETVLSEQPLVTQTAVQKAVPAMAVAKVQMLEAATVAKTAASESEEAKGERVKREAIERVKARFGMPTEVAEAISTAMQNPLSQQEPGFTPMVAFRAAQSNTQNPVMEVAHPEPASEVAETQSETYVPVSQTATPHSAPVAAQPVVSPRSAAVLSDLPPVRRVTLQQEHPQPASLPVVPWAPRVERRRVPREPIVFPRGLNKAALRMSERGQAIAKGQAGPSLTAAEQAVANKISSAHHPVAAAQLPNRYDESPSQIAEQGGRWSLLRQFGGFETEAQTVPRLEDRAAG
jgi:uncharacterized protein involved in exopolysaccharide biosynthesis